MRELKIHTDYIELGSALKLLSYVNTGGEAKLFLTEKTCLVNNEKEIRRGRKIYPGDSLVIDKEEYKVIHEN